MGSLMENLQWIGKLSGGTLWWVLSVCLGVISLKSLNVLSNKKMWKMMKPLWRPGRRIAGKYHLSTQFGIMALQFIIILSMNCLYTTACARPPNENNYSFRLGNFTSTPTPSRGLWMLFFPIKREKDSRMSGSHVRSRFADFHLLLYIAKARQSATGRPLQLKPKSE